MKKNLFRTLLLAGIGIFIVSGIASAYGPLKNKYFENRIDQMVESGAITQEQANERMEKLEEHYQSMLENKASLLGLTADELKARFEDGETFWQIAEEQGITKEQLFEQIREFKVKRFEDCPENGKEFLGKGLRFRADWKIDN